MKFLIAITPACSICFLSNFWRSRVSDKNLTQAWGFLNFLEQGELVLLTEVSTLVMIGLHDAKLEIPAFTHGKSQLTERDVEILASLNLCRTSYWTLKK